MDTQKKIIDIVEGMNKNFLGKGREWNKFHGDIVCRVFIDFISREVSPDLKVMGPNIYIRGFSTEFDILIVDMDTEHDKYINAFEPEKVKCGIESKARGTFGGRDDLRKSLERIKQNFIRVNREYPRITFFYLTYQEVANPKRISSIDYLKETRERLDPYKVFCLKESRSGNPIVGEWDKMVSFLNKCLCGQNVA
ncbi:MAG: hypothetical protein LUQ65_03345 [Candidatus Helarchaeota archaeon]|nr:hypothetical protein [Candidatus Helarchaeota archaeon]